LLLPTKQNSCLITLDMSIDVRFICTTFWELFWVVVMTSSF
jgi:hypothetical protein